MLIEFCTTPERKLVMMVETVAPEEALEVLNGTLAVLPPKPLV
jgi:hypothetical protein